MTEDVVPGERSERGCIRDPVRIRLDGTHQASITPRAAKPMSTIHQVDGHTATMIPGSNQCCTHITKDHKSLR